MMNLHKQMALMLIDGKASGGKIGEIIRRHNGETYAHLLRVARTHFLTGTNTRIAALLHDSLEDGITSYHELEGLIGNAITDLVLTLTRTPSESYEEYIDRIATSGEEPLLIKLADMLDNISRFAIPPNISLSKRVSLKHKYTQALPVLLSGFSEHAHQLEK